jgi:hypothetical protein
MSHAWSVAGGVVKDLAILTAVMQKVLVGSGEKGGVLMNAHGGTGTGRLRQVLAGLCLIAVCECGPWAGPALGASPDWSLPSQRDSTRTSVLVVVGNVYILGGEYFWPDGDSVVVVNERSGVELLSVIGASEGGRYGVAFVDFEKSSAGIVGDEFSVYLSISGRREEVGEHIVTASEIRNSLVLLDLACKASSLDPPMGNAEQVFLEYPNPACARHTGIDFRVAGLGPGVTGAGELVLYDLWGRLVRRMPLDCMRNAVARWDGRDGAGRMVPSGTYFLRMTASPEGRVLSSGRLIVVH